MDFVNKLTGNNNDASASQANQPEKKESGGFMDKINGMAGGGRESEKQEDGLDKAVDFVQEKVLGQGAQDNESAAEQAKDEQISDFIRGQYKNQTGKDFPVADKDKKYGV
ncbi:hypothetical protein C8034_v005617 [Colletotrichum sidae]|uniref:DNA damage-responsive protein 48 n=4 Tax=Colletotrichum orbiculare species complex TaxID=2707354 RepID=N4V4T7_COLOR|nr:hypothetical protein Cob_v011667 [Colletotrichum orbiculare MAFF 240422]TDZ31750.1 hypothetical protein C8035_v000874 [Colletotrichum spinosum]TDZ75018.1 hypothetical protein CTRI78_v000190 [Colletotrichum trifolii]TEA12815.1 hypothetical protein C8034_v005617 [Colletotrichum sidae]